ncbi:MAG: hypothetical protein QM501_07650 [Gimesia sp.]
MSMNLTRQYRILLLPVISVTLLLNLQTQHLPADEQPQNKPALEQSTVVKKPGNADEKQPRKLRENLKQLAYQDKFSVEPIIEEMKQAGKLIENRQTGEETQKLQQQVVQNLELLIRQLESAPRSSMKQPSQNNKQQSDNGKNSRQQKPGTEQKNVPQSTQGPASRSSERKEPGRATTGTLDNRNVYIKDAWGHLPPAMRQKLLNIYTEKFLPQYEDQVRRYYEALAEQKKRSP